ncbi:MAG TPA: hypothetical protein VI112_12115 [Bacteroidia bacterium]|jgi:hypothetical protein
MKAGLQWKSALLFFAGVTVTNISSAQFEMDKVLRVGYRLGSESFSPAYVSGSWDANNTTFNVSNSYKDHMGLTNYEIWYCRYSSHAFYETNLDGMVNALWMYITNPLHDFENQFERFKGCSKNGVPQVHGIDYDILNFRLGFGAHGLFLGGQYKWTRLGNYVENGTATNGGQVIGIGHSETNVTGLGLSLSANVSIKDFVTQSHLTFNWLKGSVEDKAVGPFFQGKEIEFESIISWGKGFGGYITPFIRKRFGNGDLHFNSNYEHAFNSSFAFGIKLGIYLAAESDEDDVYITVE